MPFPAAAPGAAGRAADLPLADVPFPDWPASDWPVRADGVTEGKGRLAAEADVDAPAPGDGDVAGPL